MLFFAVLFAAHVSAIRTHGPCPIHRRTFAPVKHWFAVDSSIASKKSALTASVHVSAATKRDVSGSKAGGAKAAVRASRRKSDSVAVAAEKPVSGSRASTGTRYPLALRRSSRLGERACLPAAKAEVPAKSLKRRRASGGSSR